MRIIIFKLFNIILTQCYGKVLVKDVLQNNGKTTPNPGLLEVINEYWCWRGQYCHNGGPHVCAREKRTDQRKMFECECTVYKYNCSYKRVLAVWDSEGRKKIQDADELFAEYHCYKLRMCRHSDEKICGFDRKASMLAIFEDLCTMFTANCKRFGVFQKVDMVVCEMQKSYQAQYANDTFEFVHLNDKLLLRDWTA